MLSLRIKTLLALWVVAEVIVFAICVHLVGFGWTALAGLVTSAVGFTMLKRTGAATLIKLRASFQGRPSGVRLGAGGEVIDSALAVLGALGLLLPGLLSDLVGIALLFRPLRDRLSTAIAGGRWASLVRRRSSPSPRGLDVVDLEPRDWRHGDISPSTPKLPR